MDVFSVFTVNPCADEQIEKGEQLLQSFSSEFDVCALCVSSLQLSNTEQGIAMLNKILKNNM
jgi:hypothetical protein